MTEDGTPFAITSDFNNMNDDDANDGSLVERDDSDSREVKRDTRK